MSRCPACLQQTDLPVGCTAHRVILGCNTVERRRYDALATSRCIGCHTIAGGYHHFGCPKEECPVSKALAGVAQITLAATLMTG